MGYGSADSVVAEIRKALAAAGSGPMGPARALGLTSAEAPSAVASDGRYPLALYIGRLMFDRGTMAGFSAVLPALAPDPFVEIHPEDARAHGIAAGDVVVVESAHGQLELVARVTGGTRPGAVFVPSGYNEAPVNVLLGGTTPVGVRLRKA
jgi:anaerobic selenocysteine-containing dehydrogenase